MMIPRPQPARSRAFAPLAATLAASLLLAAGLFGPSATAADTRPPVSGPADIAVLTSTGGTDLSWAVRLAAEPEPGGAAAPDGEAQDEEPVIARPDDVEILVDTDTRLTVSEDQPWLGEPGATVWAEGTTSGRPLTWDTTGLDDQAGGSVAVSLRAVRGPGTVSIVGHRGAEDPAVLVGSADGAPTDTALPAGERLDTSWVFSAPGAYEIDLRAELEGADIPDDVTYRAVVADGTAPTTVAPTTAPSTTPPSTTPPAPAAAPTPAVKVYSATAAPSADREVAIPHAAFLVRAAQPAGADEKVVIADGHIDMGPTLEGDTWEFKVRDDTVTPNVWRPMANVVIHGVDASKIEVPPGDQLSFLGEPGSEVWLLPQVQQAGIIWPGWNTQHPSIQGKVQGDVTWTWKKVDGPGEVSLFLTGTFGEATLLIDPGKGFPQTVNAPMNTHTHGNWAFTEPGVYRIEMTMSADKAGGGTYTDTRTLNLFIGAGDPNQAFPSADPSDPGGSGGGAGGTGGGSGGAADPGSGGGSGGAGDPGSGGVSGGGPGGAGDPGSGGGSGSGADGSGGVGSGLALTGASTLVPLTIVAVVLMGAGGAILFVRRRNAGADGPADSP